MIQNRIPRSVLFIGLLMSFGIWFPLLVVPAIEDVIGQELNISHTLTALLFSAPVAMLALIAIPGGFLADRIGIKKAVGLGSIILASGSVLRLFSSDYSSLLAFTIVYGLGLGLCFPNLPKLARHCTSKERTAITVAMFSAAIFVSGGVSLVLTRSFLYPLTHSYQGLFAVSTVPVIVASLLWWLIIKDPPCEPIGKRTVSVDLSSLRKITARKDLWLVAILFFLHNSVLYTLIGWIPVYLVSIGAKATLATIISSVILWTGALSTLVFTRLSTQLHKRKPFIWGSSILFLCVSLGALWTNVATSWILMVFIGIATAIRFTILLVLPVEMVPPEQSGSASGLVMSIGYVGALIGPVVGGFLIDSTGGYAWTFISLAIVSLITTVIAAAIPEIGIYNRESKAQ